MLYGDEENETAELLIDGLNPYFFGKCSTASSDTDVETNQIKS